MDVDIWSPLAAGRALASGRTSYTLVCNDVYYPGENVISPEEISLVSQYMEEHKILPENTRIHKTFVDGHCVYELLLASGEKNTGQEKITKLPGSKASIRLVKGEHGDELLAICHSLRQAAQYAANPRQETFLDQY